MAHSIKFKGQLSRHEASDATVTCSDLVRYLTCYRETPFQTSTFVVLEEFHFSQVVVVVVVVVIAYPGSGD
jgi:hypothetical protein